MHPMPLIHVVDNDYHNDDRYTAIMSTVFNIRRGFDWIFYCLLESVEWKICRAITDFFFFCSISWFDPEMAYVGWKKKSEKSVIRQTKHDAAIESLIQKTRGVKNGARLKLPALLHSTFSRKLVARKFCVYEIFTSDRTTKILSFHFRKKYFENSLPRPGLSLKIYRSRFFVHEILIRRKRAILACRFVSKGSG